MIVVVGPESAHKMNVLQIINIRMVKSEMMAIFLQLAAKKYTKTRIDQYLENHFFI
jgi:hypothetical protein